MIIYPVREYHKRISLAMDRSHKVVLTDDEFYSRKDYSLDWSDKKRDQGQQYVIDSNCMDTRSIHGHMGQKAVEKFLGIDFTDPDTSYDERKNIPDLMPAGLHIGVKTHRVNNPPMLDFITDKTYQSLSLEKQKKARYPQIIVTKDQNCEKTFYILGVFSCSILWHQDYVDKNLIYDDELFKKGSKIPFFGVHRGHLFNTVEELKNIIGPKWSI